VTIAIPTIRNKTDEQMQTRLLVAELPDYPGRVKEHSMAVSAQLLPDAATADYSRERWLWQEGLRQLTAIRKVVFPLEHPDFALDDDGISHGARLWANLLSLMATAAWLEQKNRRILDLAPPEGTLAIEATPDDYEVAYKIFNAVCKRTVVNLSDTHRGILDGLYELHEHNPERYGFRQREIVEAGGVSLGAVSNHKTFLVMSAKLLKESDDGLALVEGANPSWWETGEMMEGLPTPAQVRSWWEERDPDPPDPPEHGEHMNTGGEGQEKRHNYAGSGVHVPYEQDVNTSMNTEGEDDPDKHVHGLFIEGVNSQNGSGMGNGASEEDLVHVFTPFTPPEDGAKVVHHEREPFDVYIGRGGGRTGQKKSKWHNPFVVGKDGDREECIERFSRYLLESPELMAALPEIRGKILGCHCAEEGGLTKDDPLECHGQVLLRLATSAEDDLLDDEEEL